ncbi:MAG: hypothetical protein KF678_15135 [Phycisphaeraceae bacterium]|nr:hypothetical protein [Phycisphaeraceae bacterium]
MIPPRLRPGIILSAAAAAGAAVFALWPVKPRTIPAPVIERAPEPAKRTLAALDLAAFRAPIWVAEPPPPAPPAPVPAPPPPPPLKIQLLAIIREAETGGYKAAVYDPDTDKVLIVAAGERLGPRTVEQIDQTSLTLSDNHGKRVLALKDGAP